MRLNEHRMLKSSDAINSPTFKACLTTLLSIAGSQTAPLLGITNYTHPLPTEMAAMHGGSASGPTLKVSTAPSNHPQLRLPLLRNPLRAPRRVPGHIDLRV